MHLTVAICTWNRASLLDQTLTTMQALEVPSHISWELLVVNNNCSDNTDSIIAKHEPRLPIRRLFEQQQGKSFAMNHAIREARGEYILWIDDDVLVDPMWMAAYSQAFVDWPNAAVFGGPVRPCFSETPPQWLKEVLPRVGGAYAVQDLGNEPVRLGQTTVPFGANMATRASEQAKYLYDTNLGPRGNHLITGEDVELMRRMLAAGFEGRWVPGASVRHYIPGHRQTVRYLKHWYRGHGAFFASQKRDDRFLKIFGRPLWVWREAFQAEARYRIRRMLCDPKVWIEDLIISSMAWGRLRAWQR